MDSFYLGNAAAYWASELTDSLAPVTSPGGIFYHQLNAQTFHGAGRRVVWLESEYDFEFDYAFDEKEELNSGEFVIYNLTDETLRSLYVGDPLLVYGGFSGESGTVLHTVISELTTEWDGGDKATTLGLVESGEGAAVLSFWTGYDLGKAADAVAVGPGGPHFFRSYAAGITARVILADLIEATGMSRLEVSLEADRVFAGPVVVEGALFTLLQHYAAECGATAYTSGGLLVVRNPAVNRSANRLLIGEGTGLLEAPAPFTEQGAGDQAPEYRGYKVKMLGNVNVLMGAPVLLQSRGVDAALTVLRGRHSFDGVSFVTEATLVE